MNASKIWLPRSSFIFAAFVFLLEIWASAGNAVPTIGEQPAIENNRITVAGARTGAAATLSKSNNNAKPRLAQNYGKIPLYFEANHGQTDSQVKFLARGRGYGLFLTATEAVIELRNAGLLRSGNRHSKPETRDSRLETALRMKLVDASAAAKVEGMDPLAGRTNYFIGNDSKKWHTDIPTYSRVRYSQIYPGIDLVYYGNQHQLEYDFVIGPGTDPGKIALDVLGADKVEVSPQGDLLLHVPGGVVLQRKAFVYQEVNGIRREVSGSYVVEGTHRLRFRLADYDSSKPLVIDPTLDYSTYLGGSGRDQGFGIAVDAAGNAYVTGETTSSFNFPIIPGSVQTHFGGGLSDVFVAKLDPTGSSLIYSTYLGGGLLDQGFGIAVDAGGNAYVAGLTLSTNFPTTPGALKRTLGGIEDAFVAKLNSTGSALVYSTYLGGSSTDFALSIALDAAGNTYVTGGTSSADFPVSPGAFQTSFRGGIDDAFVTKVNPSGSAIVYSTYLGGAGSDEGFGIAVDASDSAYISGETTSTNFPTSSGSVQATYHGGQDGFAVKLDTGGAHMAYGTYLGGSAFDQAKGIAVDAHGNAYVTGDTTSINFPTTPGALQPTSGGGDDAFVTQLNASGSAFVYSTYLGGMSVDFGEGIAVDSTGNAYVTGGTKSVNFPITSDATQTTLRGSDDVFISKLNAAGSALIYSTYLGGTASDEGFSIAVDSSGATYVTGETTSVNFPTSPGAFQRALVAGMDAFIVKIAGAAPPLTITCPADIVTSTAPGECSRVVDFPMPSSPPGSTVTCSPASGSTFPKGTTTVSCTATDSAATTATCSFSVTVNDNEKPAITCPADITTVATSSAGAMVNYPTPSVSDNCPGAIVSSTPASGSVFPLGTTPVISTATDSSGNTSTCIFTVTVTPPLAIICPDPVVKSTDTGQCSAVVDYPAPTASGGVAPVTTSCSQPSGSSFPKRTMTVTCMATDSAGNTANCSFTVTVNDNEHPTITAPPNLTVNTDPGKCFASGVALGTPTTSDNCGVASVTNDAPAVLPKGSMLVTWMVTDTSGNTAAATQMVTVSDTEKPAITAPPNVTVSTNPGKCFASGVALGMPTTSDNCGVASVTNDAPAVFPKGSTLVTWMVTDASGNTAAATQTVRVNDNEPPRIVCQSNMTVFQDSAFGATVIYPSPAVSDNCSEVTVVSTPLSGAVLPLGTTAVNYTATDTSGNTATCMFTVAVLPPPSTSGAKLTGGGSILVAGGEATFGLEAMVKAGKASGNLTYQDHVTGQTVKSTLVTAVLVTGTHARIFGKATINGVGLFDFVVDMDDLGEPGAGLDRFGIQLSNGYTAGGILEGGNIQIH